MGRKLGFNDPKPFLRRHFPYRDSKCCGLGALEPRSDDEATQTAGPWTGAHQAQVIVTVVYKGRSYLQLTRCSCTPAARQNHAGDLENPSPAFLESRGLSTRRQYFLKLPR